MKGINFVTNSDGEKIALLIDLKEPDDAIIEILEEIEDLIDKINIKLDKILETLNDISI